MGYVYLIGSSTFGWYKIGKSLEPQVRVRDIGILLPFKITIFAIWQARAYSRLETELHHRYVDSAINGEWFKFEPIQISEIILKTEAQLVYPSRDPGITFAAFSNIPEDQYILDKKRFTKAGKQRPSLVRQKQGRLRADLYREAWKTYLQEHNLPDTPENRKIARAHLDTLYTKSGLSRTK